MDRKPFKKRTLAWIAICAVCLVFLAVVTAPAADGRLRHNPTLTAEQTH